MTSVSNVNGTILQNEGRKKKIGRKGKRKGGREGGKKRKEGGRERDEKRRAQ